VTEEHKLGFLLDLPKWHWRRGDGTDQREKDRENLQGEPEGGDEKQQESLGKGKGQVKEPPETNSPAPPADHKTK